VRTEEIKVPFQAAPELNNSLAGLSPLGNGVILDNVTWDLW
jgi:hypothetical protein